MTLDDLIPLVLAVFAMTASLALVVRRIRLNGLHSNARRRYLFIDVLVLLASIEMFVDTLADNPHDMSDPVRFVSTLARGAVTAGIIALLLSFPHYRRDREHHRRYDDP